LAARQASSISSRLAGGEFAPLGGEARLDGVEAALEFGIAVAQRGLRIGVQMARQVDHGEQQVADLVLDPVRRPAIGHFLF